MSCSFWKIWQNRMLVPPPPPGLTFPPRASPGPATALYDCMTEKLTQQFTPDESQV